MSIYELELAIDFGDVGFGDGKRPFRLRLETGPLAGLIRATEDAHRVYELLLIDRPGDVWDYVWVMLDEVPPRVTDLVVRARRAAQQTRDSLPWPDDRVPFKEFDRLFQWGWDDTEPEDAAWLHHRNSGVMRSFAQQALSFVRAAQSRLEWSDPLLRHIVSRARSDKHSYCYFDRDVARKASRELGPNENQHTPGFYEKLSEVLCYADLASVAYFPKDNSIGDYRILRMMATEQRRRANLTGHDAVTAMHLSALLDVGISNEAWDSEILFYGEGSPRGDLIIMGRGNYKAPAEFHDELPFSFVFASRDEGSIIDPTWEAGDGWVLYRKQNPDSRRIGLQRINYRHRDKSCPVLSFAESGATLFDHEKAVVLVGVEVSTGARVVLASVIAEWQRRGGDPMLVVLGDATPFDLAGCKHVLSVPCDAADEDSLARWLALELQRSRPWIDVVIALFAPEWATQTLAGRWQHFDDPWATWVVATKGVPHLTVDHWLEGDLEQVLREAQKWARARWPSNL